MSILMLVFENWTFNYISSYEDHLQYPSILVRLSLKTNNSQYQQKKLEDELKYEDPLKKPLALDDGRWAVFCW